MKSLTAALSALGEPAGNASLPGICGSLGEQEHCKVLGLGTELDFLTTSFLHSKCNSKKKM